MAYDVLNLSKVSGHANYALGGFWEYKEDATVAAISASGYLNGATNVLQLGDVIVVRGNNGTALRQVTSATGAATVTVAALTA